MRQSMARFIRLHRFSLMRCLAGSILILLVCLSFNLIPFTQVFEDLKFKARKIALESSPHTATPTEKRIMLDSLLTILQDYYVDDKKIESFSLLKSTLAKLKDDINVEINEIDRNRINIVYDDMSLNLSIVEPYSYNQLLQHSLGISAFLDDLISKGKINAAGNAHDELNNGPYIFANAMLAGLDEHSAVLDSYSYDELRQSTEGSFGGLGIIVGVRNNLLTVLKPIPNSPASKAGIKKGDRILRINDVSTYGVPLGDLINSMRGNPGTTAQLVLLRAGKMSSQTISLKREVIKLDSVTHSLLSNGKYKFLHISIDTFSATTSDELSDLLTRYLQDRTDHIHGIIMDLRSNPGGLLDQATKVADLFIRQGTIVSTIGRYREVETAGNSDFKVYLPMVVLINGDSASASEIVAGALQDNNRAVIIGQPSFGKGSVQTIFEYPRNQAIKLTIAKYYTPSGRSIQGTGITPDIWLQPILQAEENFNIFGDYRYHQLDSTYILPDQARAPPKIGITYAIKSNYLVQTHDGISDTDESRDMDFEVRFSQFMLRSLLDHYGPTVPDGMQRASHWLAIATNAAHSYLKKSNAEAIRYMQSKFQVDWTGSNDPAVPTDGVVFNFTSSPKLSKEGQPITLDWEITNHTHYVFPQISLFMGPNVLGYEYMEKAVGRLNAWEDKKGSFTLPAVNPLHFGKIAIKGGLASGHVPLANSIRKTDVTIKPQEKPKLYSTAVLCDSRNKKPLSAIKPADEADLEVTIFNEGNVSSSQTDIDVENLSGEQIVVTGPNFHTEAIMPRTRIRHYFTLKAADALFSNKLIFGIRINSADLSQPIFQEISINALPNNSASNQRALLSH